MLDEARENSSPDVSWIMSEGTTGTEKQYTPVPPVTKMFNLFWEKDIVGEEGQCEVMFRVDPGLQFYMPLRMTCSDRRQRLVRLRQSFAGSSVIRVITKACLLSATMGAC